MKKTLLITLTIFTTVLFFSCKDTKKNDQETTKTSYLVVDKEKTAINWTAYKTTDKIPVKGSFTKFTIENQPNGTNPKEALNGLTFKIPVNSLATNDTIRDAKLINYFFGSMENTVEISGEINISSDTEGTAKISMNGISQTFPINYVVANNNATLNATIDLNNWQAAAAIEALNVVCYELHMGPDGISKTWNDVAIEVIISFQESENNMMN
jgi:hypothetical protein